jgi:hypothetical protein
VIDLGPAAITARLRQASALSDLTTGRRLNAKLDMSPAEITRRLARVEALRRLCAALGAIGAASRAAERGAP